jgi:hypothetical protein
MKYTINLLVVAILGFMVLPGCDKESDNPFFEEGKAVTLSPSVTTIAPAPADSNNVALTLNWTYPDYSTDSSNIKYVIEIDSAGKNFANPARKTIIKDLRTTYIAKELNTILLAKGYAFNVPVDMDVRVISSFVNNNERLTSNTVRIKMTPYKVPPKVALPTSGRLFIVGDATTFGWSNDAAPAFPPDREFSRIDETTWGGVFFLDGAGAWKLLQTQGNWDTQFHMAAGGTATEGSFILENADPGIPSPTAGWYKVIIDFQAGKYKVTSFGADPLPQTLWITGDATPSSWTNTPPANQQLTRLNSAEYQITMAFTSGLYYKFLTTQNQWQPQWGRVNNAANNAAGGELGANYGATSDPESISTPATAGNYKVKVNFATGRYTVSL